MRRIAAAAALLLGASTALIFTAPIASAATNCNGTIAHQTVSAITVQPHASCTLNDVTVKNDVTATDPASINISHSLIKGKLDVDQTAGYSIEMVVSCTTMGSVRIRHVAANDELSLDGGTDEGTCGPNLVRGNVKYANNYGDVDLELTTVGGNVTASNNWFVSFEGNTIQGDRTCNNNSNVELPEPHDVVHGTDTCTQSD